MMQQGERHIRDPEKENDERLCWEMIDSINSIVLRWGTDLRITFINDFALEFFGYRREDVLGQSILGTIVPPKSDTGRDLAAMVRNIVRDPERFVNNENENIRRDGKRVWVNWTNRAVRDREGRVVEILSVGNDVTRRKTAEEALKNQLKATQVLLDAIPVPVFYKDASGIYTGCNRAFAAFLGKPKSEIIGKTVYQVSPPDLADVYYHADEELIHHPGTQVYETSVVYADGTRHDVIFNKATYLNEDGTVGGLIGTIIDITKRKDIERELIKARGELEQRVLERTKELEQANEFLRREAIEHKRDEEALQESEENLTRAQQIAHVGIWDLDIERGVLHWSDEIYKIAGVTPDTFTPSYEAFLKIIVPEDRERVDQAVKGSVSEGKHYKEEFYIQRPDGKQRFVSCEGGTIFGPGGNAARLLGVCYDITDRKHAEDALRESEERFRATFEQAAVGIAHLALDGRYIRVNQKYCEIVGYACKELTKLSYKEITYPEDRKADEELARQLLTGKIHTGSTEKRYICKDGNLVWVNMTVSLICDGQGRPDYFIAVIQDITDRKQAEEAVKKAKARAELYLDLMGHDISNMNQAMMGYLEMAQELLDLKGHEELIERPLEIIKHSSRLIANVKKLEQIQARKYPAKTVNLCQMLREVVDKYAVVPGRDVKINIIPAGGCLVCANDLLADIFDNLVDNAIRHSAGPLTVDISIEPVLEEGRKYYMVSVADNGPGIPGDLKSKIFRFVDPATGSPGRRGLGLYMVRTLVESYHGRVWAEDRVPGDYHKGSRFVVLLPVAD